MLSLLSTPVYGLFLVALLSVSAEEKSIPVSLLSRIILPTLSNAIEIRGDNVQPSTFACIKSNNVQTVFIQAFQSNGFVDPNLVTNINNAHTAGLGIEIFITPQISSGSSTCAQQLTAVVTALQRGGITLRSVWLMVTTPILWNSNVQQNINFIASCLQLATNSGYGIGIFTNSYDWNQITQNWSGWQQMAPMLNLWYWQNSGPGQAGSSPPNFNDFVAFAGFSSPVVKEYSIEMSLCSIRTNYNVYIGSSKNSVIIKNDVH